MKNLKQGDCIGIVSPSSPAAGVFKYRFDRGVEQLQNMGFNIKVGNSTLKITDYSAGSPEERANDINTFFADKEISAIICTIGGEHSCEILEYLDFTTIKNNPKIFIGYSDITVLLLSIWAKCHMPIFYGPTLLTEFSEFGGTPRYTQDWFTTALMKPQPIGNIESSNIIADEFIPWGSNDDKTILKKFKKTESFEFIKDGHGEGIIMCACIEALTHLKGTEFLPDFSNAILFIETASDKPNIPYLAAQLSDLSNMGVFEKIKGLVFGKKNWAEIELARLKNLLIKKTNRYTFPILYGLDFGHISPIVTLPIGCSVELSSLKNFIKITTSPF